MRVNRGDRPSRLDQGRRLSGEQSGPVDPAYAEAIAAEVVEPFDFVAIRARAARIEDPPSAPAPAPWWRKAWIALPILAAAALLVTFLPTESERVKGTVDLSFYVLDGDRAVLGDATATFRAGDRLQFSYLAGGYTELILLSIDGTGSVSSWYPAEGEEGVPVTPGGRHVLEGSIVLDEAPGPEVFLAFFGEWSRGEAESEARAYWDRGGVDALRGLAEEDPTIVALALRKE